jgi:hypothetical protein
MRSKEKKLVPLARHKAQLPGAGSGAPQLVTIQCYNDVAFRRAVLVEWCYTIVCPVAFGTAWHLLLPLVCLPSTLKAHTVQLLEQVHAYEPAMKAPTLAQLEHPSTTAAARRSIKRTYLQMVFIRKSVVADMLQTLRKIASALGTRGYNDS